MFRMSWTVFIFASGLALGQAPQPGPSVASIESLIRSHDYNQALQMTRERLHEAPNDFRIWTLQGIVLSLKGSSPDALTAFDKALVLSPNYPPALKGEVQLLYQAADKRAIPLLE